MNDRLIDLGYGSYVASARILSIVNPESAPIKRLIQDAREQMKLIDATFGKKTRAVIIVDSGHVILAAIEPETVTARAMQGDEKVLFNADLPSV
ncbi:DUF370 domain-containing protein [Ferroacidibacillus organovorans]|uniref:Putative regulatory protein AYW79_13530 n=1 Tax=Ferroacidibacillus organovorans TaxID=1765683 RepID=A0A853K911_9BACL|nr:DUF370 domain-containing protein [Ferroacidibacillus organovorans]KYP79754.1 hypothetical protein AYJ22_13790 [Ferroacidibacillus organovorans]OAG92188.1 hypothetical protein AYW79_13530 [Ferroacidibacillus organovorans]